MTGKLKRNYSLPKCNGMLDWSIDQYMDVLLSHYFGKFNFCLYWLMTEASYRWSLYRTMEWHVMDAQDGGGKMCLCRHTIHIFRPRQSPEIVQWILSSRWDKDCRMCMGYIRALVIVCCPPSHTAAATTVLLLLAILLIPGKETVCRHSQDFLFFLFLIAYWY